MCRTPKGEERVGLLPSPDLWVGLITYMVRFVKVQCQLRRENVTAIAVNIDGIIGHYLPSLSKRDLRAALVPNLQLDL